MDANNVVWTVLNMDVRKNEDGLTDVVKTVHWEAKYTDGDYSIRRIGAEGLQSPNPNDFVLFESLTQAQVIEWTKNSIFITEEEAAKEDAEGITEARWLSSLESAMERKKNPPSVTKLPDSWND